MQRLARLALLPLVVGMSLQAFAQDATRDLLQKLSNAPEPPGAEEPVRKIMLEHMKPLANAPVRYDGMGSVIAQQGSTGPRIMIDAHMDELGGMVRRVTPNGFLTMQMLGGWLDQALVDQRWVILGSKGPVHAVTGIRDIHVLPAEERTRVFSRESLLIDVGAKDDAQVAALGVEPGDTFAGHPDETQAKLGGGPGLFLFDSSAMANRKFVALVKKTAADHNLPLQLDLVQGYGDDSAEIQESNGGVPTVNLVAPIRYTHSHNGILNRRDFDQLVDLLTNLLVSLDRKTVDQLRDFTPQ